MSANAAFAYEPAGPLCPDPDCGLPAEVEDRWTWGSTDGPVEMVKVRCVGGCWYTVPEAELHEP